MSNPLSTSDAPDLMKRKVYIKNDQRKIPTSDGYMHMPATVSRRTFGKLQGGKYSIAQ